VANERTQFSRALLALIVGQVGLHASMTGVRMAAPLQALQQGRSAWAVGVLMALFAVAPIVLALPSGRMADRHGYHRPIGIAVWISFAGCVVAAVSSHYLAMCVAAVLTGAGANIGMIVIQRTSGRLAHDSTERMRIFSWLALAPAVSNMLGPLAAGALIDVAGYRAAFAAMLLLPLFTLACARMVPREQPAERPPARGSHQSSWDLLRMPDMRRLLLVNWLVSASWDAHSFIVPILGHERGLSASAIGLVLGVFAAAVTLVRLAIPILAHRLTEAQVLVGSMVMTALVFAIYPLCRTAWPMALCATVLGLALGAVQPMIMSALHHITPDDRHGEAIAFRSIAINMSSTLMPLMFGLAGTAIGVGSLFWVMGAAVGSGSVLARGVGVRT
jgi:MFS family permease